MLDPHTNSQLWQAYKATYYDTLMGLRQTEIQSLINKEAMKEFPNNLPTHLRETLVKGLIEVSKALITTAKMAEDRKGGSIKISSPKTKDDQKLLGSTVLLYAAMMGTKKGKRGDTKVVIQQGFERIISSQTLIMIFAHIDAFLSDTVRIICSVHPEVLRNEKKIDWATAIAFETKDQLLEYLRERFVLEFGLPNLSKRVEYLSKNLGIEIDRTKFDLGLLDIAENTRHIVIHNGGKVSQEYLERTKCTDVKVGDFIPIGFTYVDSVAKASNRLLTEVFEAVSRKFFGTQDIDFHTLS